MTTTATRLRPLSSHKTAQKAINAMIREGLAVGCSTHRRARLDEPTIYAFDDTGRRVARLKERSDSSAADWFLIHQP